MLLPKCREERRQLCVSETELAESGGLRKARQVSHDPYLQCPRKPGGRAAKVLG